jgi:FkbM family methyltransferase
VSKQAPSFLGSSALGGVLSELAPVRCFDIGARGGPAQDLDDLGGVVEMYGFEPDGAECARLNEHHAARNRLYRSIRFFPVALGAPTARRTLHIMRAAASSTFLQPNVERGRAFSRPDYVTVVSTAEVPTMPIDEFVRDHNVQGVHYLKIDVEGLELEVFRSALGVLASELLAIRSEHYFTPLHHGQPRFQDQASFLSQFDFVPMEILHPQHWRRLTLQPHLVRCDHPIPYSRGQLMHADVLYFRDPDTLPDRSEEQIRLLLKAAYIAMAHEFVDHAYCIFMREGVKRYLDQRFKISVQDELRRVSLTLAERRRRQEWRAKLGRIKAGVPILNRVSLAGFRRTENTPANRRRPGP